MSLYTHVRHPHKPRNANDVHEANLRESGLNTRIAVTLTKTVGTMWTAYVFTVLSLVGLLGLLGLLSPFTFLLCTWVSQMFLQLVLLPVIMVGQNVLSKHQEVQADETFNTTQHSFHDIEEVMKHLDAQDEKILAILEKLQAAKGKP